MLHSHKQSGKTNNSGFSLVELIVVIVIMLVLAAAMVPAVSKYIGMAREAQLVNEAKDLMNGTRIGIAEAFLSHAADFKSTVKLSKYTPVGKKYGFYSSYLLATQQGNASSASTNAKNVITASVLEYIGSTKGDKMRYKFYNGMVTGGFDPSKLKDDEIAYLVLYDTDGAILFMQYARSGLVVTFDGSSYTVEAGRKFINFQ